MPHRGFDVTKLQTIVLTAMFLGAPVAPAQQEPPAATNTGGAGGGEALPGLRRLGVHLYTASFFGDYYSNGLPANFSTSVGNLQSDVAYGGSLSMGWIHNGSRLTSSVSYSPSYSGRMRYSNLHSFGQHLNANFNLQLNPKWSVNFSAVGSISDLQRSISGASAAAQLAGTPATFNGLATALSSGQASNPQMSAILNAAVATSPANAILFGTRYLTAGLSTNVSYARSERLNLSMGVNASRTQTLSQNSSLGVAAPVPILPKSTVAGVHASVFYGLTPRLSLNGSWTASRNFRYRQAGVPYGSSIVHNTNLSVSYLVGMKWMFTGGGGLGYLPFNGIVVPGKTASAGILYLGTGSVAYKFFSQSLVARVSRSVTNAYGLGGATSLSGDLGWNWNRPGSGWGMTLDGGYQAVNNPRVLIAGSSTLGGWRGSAALHRTLTRRLFWSTSYTYLRSTGVYNAVNYGLVRSSVQVSLSWSFADLTGPFGQ
jgi:hypothetical protein